MNSLLTTMALADVAALPHLDSSENRPQNGRSDEPSKDLLAELKSYPHKIVYESNRDGNWELYLMNADGSDPVNLTRTPDVDELYPKPSPDGSKVCFVADEGEGDAAVRCVYYIRCDGSGRAEEAKRG